MPFELHKIGNPATERPKIFPAEVHDPNIDLIQAKVAEIDNRLDTLETSITASESDIFAIQQDVIVLSQQVDVLETQVINISANYATIDYVNTQIATISSGDASAITYNANPSYATVEEALNFLLYVSPVISGFSNDVGTIEVGVSVSTVNLSWSYNKTMVTASLNQGIGSISSAINSYVHNLGSPLNPTDQTTTTYTLTVNDGTTGTSANSSINHRHKRYWGTSSSTSLNSAAILGLANSEFATSNNKTYTTNGNGEYLYYCYPTSFGTASFTVNGLPSTAWTESTVSFTNASGHTRNYYVYRSNTIQNGTGISIVVS